MLHRTLLAITIIGASIPGIAAQTHWRHFSTAKGDLPLPWQATEQTAAVVHDLDGDGTNDFVVASRKVAPALVWYRRTAQGWDRYVIEPAMLRVEAGGAVFDIDVDGDADLVFGGDGTSNEMWWWENPSPEFAPGVGWSRHLIKQGGGNAHHDQVFADLKGTGRPQLITWNQGTKRLLLSEIPANPREAGLWPLIEILDTSNVPTATKQEGMTVADIDGDGREDLLAGLYWLKHIDGDRFKAIQIVDRPGRLAAGKFKPGRSPQIVFAPGDANGPIRWYECTGDPENPSDWHAHDLLDSEAVHAHSLQVADIDADGRLDIFAAEMAKWGRTEEVENPAATAWIWYGDGRGSFRRTVFQKGFGFHEAKVADLDGDGLMDVLSKPYTWRAPRIDVWLQQRMEGAGCAASRPDALQAGQASATGLARWAHVLADDKREPTSRNNRGSFGIAFGDLDEDGDLDIVSGRYFYRNPGGDITKRAWPRVTLPTDTESGRPLDAGLFFNLNGSGPTLDVIAQALPNVVWLHATDRRGERWTATVVAQAPPTRHGDGRSMRLAKIVPGNERPDILLSAGGGTFLLQIPDNPESSPWPITKITHTEYDEQKSLGLGDVDRDGDLDLVLPAGRGKTEVEWWRNPGRVSVEWVKRVIGHTVNDAKMIEVQDVNGDGRADVVATDSEAPDCGIYWFEARDDPAAGVCVRHDVARGYEGLDSLSVADLAGDRRPEIVVGETKGRRRLVVYVNEDGGKSWRAHLIDEGKESHKGAQAVDLDGDGDLDLVSIAYFAFTDLHIWRNDNKNTGRR